MISRRGFGHAPQISTGTLHQIEKVPGLVYPPTAIESCQVFICRVCGGKMGEAGSVNELNGVSEAIHTGLKSFVGKDFSG